MGLLARMEGMRLAVTALCLAGALSAAAPARGAELAAGAITLVDAGRSGYVIYLAPDASPPAEQAAAELQSYLERISGCRLPIARGEEPPQKAVLIGEAGKLAGVDVQAEGLEDAVHRRATGEPGEGFVIRTVGQRLVIAGIIPRATLYGVYEFLEGLGCRFFTLDPDDEVIPERRSLVIPSTDTVEKAGAATPVRYTIAFDETIGSPGSAEWPESLNRLDWYAKLRINTLMIPVGYKFGRRYEGMRDRLLPELRRRGFMIAFGEHQFLLFLMHYDLLKQEGLKNWAAAAQRLERQKAYNYPDFTSDDDVRHLIANTLLFLQDHPEADVLSLFLPDVGNRNLSSICKGELLPSPEDVWLRSVNRIQAAVNERYPDVIAEALVGYGFRGVPKETLPNADLRLLWQGWQSLYPPCRGGISWSYGRGTFIPRFDHMNALGHGKMNGPYVGALAYQRPTAWWSEAFWFYLGFRRQWDKTLSDQQFLDDYLSSYYPQSQALMRKYVSGFGILPEDAGITDMQHHGEEEIFAESEQAGEQAYAMVKDGRITDPKEATRIRKAYLLAALINRDHELGACSKKLTELAQAEQALTAEQKEEARQEVRKAIGVHRSQQALLDLTDAGDGILRVDWRTGEPGPKGHSLYECLLQRPDEEVADLLNAVSEGPYAWWEAEDAEETDLPSDFEFAPKSADERARLSAGDWVGAVGAGGPPGYHARYRVDVPETGSYYLWVRKLQHQTPFRWRFGAGPWRRYSRHVDWLSDEGSDKVEFRPRVTAMWKYLGIVRLEQGEQEFRVEFAPGPDGQVRNAFDCFLLSAGSFTPRGTRRPQQ